MVTVRAAEPEDLEVCLSFPATYTTRVAWQLAIDGDPSRNGPLHMSLQQMRLPRLLTLTLPSALIPLQATWDMQDLILLALDNEVACGYLCLQLLPDQGQGLITRLLVNPPSRGKGAGTALVRTALGWASAQGLMRLLAYTPLRNTPGSTFYQQRGFRICGISEHFYPTREDALLLERWL